MKRRPCSYPEIPVTVFVKAADAIFFWLQMHKAYGLKYRWNRGKTLQTGSKKSDPDTSIAIFKQGDDAIFCKAVGIAELITCSR